MINQPVRAATTTNSQLTHVKLPGFLDELKHSWQVFKFNLTNFIKFYFLILAISFVTIIIFSVSLLLPLLANLNHFNLIQTNPSKLLTVVPSWSWIFVVVVICLGIFFIILLSLATSASLMLIADNETETELAVITLLKKGFRFAPSLIILSLIGLFFSGSFWLFIIPWIIIIFFMSFASYEIVLNRQKPWQAVKNSFLLFSQFAGTIVVRLIILGLIIGVITLVYQSIIGFGMSHQTMNSSSLLIMLGQQILQLVLSWFSVVFMVILYKDVKANSSSEKHASITWAVVTSVIGWFIFVIFASLLIIGLKQMLSNQSLAKFAKRATQEIENKQAPLLDESSNLPVIKNDSLDYQY